MTDHGVDSEEALNQHDDYLGWRLKSNLDLSYWENKHFQTNAAGIRSSRDDAIEPDPGVTRIIKARFVGHWFYNGHALVAKYIKSFFEAEELIESSNI